MLDDENRQVKAFLDIADKRGQRLRFLWVHARSRLIQQKQRGVRRQRAGNFQQPLLAVGQRRGRLIPHILQPHDA